MIFGASPWIEMASRFGLFVLMTGMLLIVFRIVRGPQNADRIIALDLLRYWWSSLLYFILFLAGKKPTWMLPLPMRWWRF